MAHRHEIPQRVSTLFIGDSFRATRVWHTPGEACASRIENHALFMLKKQRCPLFKGELSPQGARLCRFRLSIGERTPKKIVQKGSVRVDRR